MDIIVISLISFGGGLAVLSYGATLLVRGSSCLAVRMGVRPLVVGLTVVAFGTSAPEMVTSIVAALTDSPEIAIGNVVGSNIANVGLILGLTALILPIVSDRSFLRMDMPYLFGAMAVLYLVSLDGLLGRIDGVIMLAGLLAFVYMTYRTAGQRGEVEDEVPDELLSLPKEILLTLAGLAGLTAGAHYMVKGAVDLAELMGVSKLVIGATIVAIGTSLPELATSLAAVLKKKPDIGLGNIIGSNVFNICSILGVAPLLKPIPVEPHLLKFEYPIMILFSVALLFMLAKRRNLITRPEGILLFAGFIAFLVWSFVTGQTVAASP